MLVVGVKLKMKIIKIKEHGIEVMRTNEEISYKNFKLKGWKQIEAYQLVYVLGDKYRKRFLKELDGKWNWFWVKKRKQDKFYSALNEDDGRLRVDGYDFDDIGRCYAFGVFYRRKNNEHNKISQLGRA